MNIASNISYKGKDKKEFQTRIKEVSDDTFCLNVMSGDISIFTPVQFSDKTVSGFLHTGMQSNPVQFTDVQLRDAGVRLENLKEAMMLFIIRDKVYQLDKTSMNTLSQRAGISVMEIEEKEIKLRLHRDAFMAAFWAYKNQLIKLLVRTDETGQKIFAGFTMKYQLVRQDELFEPFLSLQLYKYHIDHQESYALFDVQQKGSLSCGFLVRDSDTGFSSFSVASYIRSEEGLFILDIYSLEHVEKMKEKMEKELPEKIKTMQKHAEDILSDIFSSSKEMTAADLNTQKLRSVIGTRTVKKTFLPELEKKTDKMTFSDFVEFALSVEGKMKKNTNFHAENLRKTFAQEIVKKL